MPKPQKYLGRLARKIAIVTGAGTKAGGTGTGAAIATLFAGEGAKLCLVDNAPDRAQGTLAAIEAEGGTAFVALGDVANAKDCARFVADTIARYGGIDLLVNNVGIIDKSGRDPFDEDDWTRVVDVNLKSAVLMSHAAIPAMAARGGGAIVNISSIASLRAYGGAFGYGLSKAGLNALTRELAVAYGRQGIRANTIAPGHIYTPLVREFLDEEGRELRRRIGPLGIEGDAWDVAAAALFLASDEARFITAQLLPVDGGVIETGSLTARALTLS